MFSSNFKSAAVEMHQSKSFEIKNKREEVEMDVPWADGKIQKLQERVMEWNP